MTDHGISRVRHHYHLVDVTAFKQVRLIYSLIRLNHTREIHEGTSYLYIIDGDDPLACLLDAQPEAGEKGLAVNQGSDGVSQGQREPQQ
jgi:hypothetical protein